MLRGMVGVNAPVWVLVLEKDLCPLRMGWCLKFGKPSGESSILWLDLRDAPSCLELALETATTRHSDPGGLTTEKLVDTQTKIRGQRSVRVFPLFVSHHIGSFRPWTKCGLDHLQVCHQTLSQPRGLGVLAAATATAQPTSCGLNPSPFSFFPCHVAQFHLDCFMLLLSLGRKTIRFWPSLKFLLLAFLLSQA